MYNFMYGPFFIPPEFDENEEEDKTSNVVSKRKDFGSTAYRCSGCGKNLRWERGWERSETKDGVETRIVFCEECWDKDNKKE